NGQLFPHIRCLAFPPRRRGRVVRVRVLPLKFASLFDFRRLFATLSGAHPAPRGGGRLSRGTRPRRYTAASSARRAKAQSGTSSTSMYRASAWKNRGSTKRT